MAAVRRALVRLRAASGLRRAQGDRGATFVEYGLITVLFASGMFGAASLLNGAMSANYNSAESRVSVEQSELPAPSLPPYVPPACAEPTPFLNPITGLCEASVASTCSGSTPIYNPGTNTCEASLAGTCSGSTPFYNAGTNRCEAYRSCPGEWLNTATNTCEPSQQPTCAAAGQGWNSVDNTCVACTASQWFNAGTGVCDLKTVCIGSQTFNNANNTCTPPTCTASQWYNSTTGVCDAKTVCIGSQTFNNANNTCTPPTCTASQWYNSTTGVCDLKTVCIGEQTFNSANNTCTAPTCTASQWYNAGTGVCDAKTVCIGEQTFNSANNTCTAPTCTASQWYNAGTGVCDLKTVCIGSQTFNDANNTCTQPTCSAPDTLNASAGTCVPGVAFCALTNKFYNSSTTQCVVGGTCSDDKQIRRNPIASCANLPVRTSDQSMDGGTTATFNILTNSSYASAPYSVTSVNITKCTTNRGSVACSVSGTSVTVAHTYTGTKDATIQIEYTIVVSWTGPDTATRSEGFDIDASAP